MFDADKPLFLQVNTDSKHQVLHPGKIIAVDDDTYTWEFPPEEVLSCEEDQTAFMYFYLEDDRTFMQQTARICSITTVASKRQITLETTSPPISAENRECYRVSTAMLGLTVAVADEKDCPLHDVSASGMSATTTLPLKLGDEVPLTLSYDGQEYTGQVIVHSVRDLGGGQIRHGFRCVQNRRFGGTLRQGLQAISVSVQRLHINRRVQT